MRSWRSSSQRSMSTAAAPMRAQACSATRRRTVSRVELLADFDEDGPDGLELLRPGGQRRLDPFLLGDVLLDRHIVGDLALGIPHPGDGGGLPVQFPTLLLVVEFPPPLLPGGDRGPEAEVRFDDRLAGFQDAGILPTHLLHGIPGHLREPGVDVLDGPIGIGDHHGDGALFNTTRDLPKIIRKSRDLGSVSARGQEICSQEGGQEESTPQDQPGLAARPDGKIPGRRIYLQSPLSIYHPRSQGRTGPR